MIIGNNACQKTKGNYFFSYTINILRKKITFNAQNLQIADCLFYFQSLSLAASTHAHK